MAHEEFRPTDIQGALAHLVEECGEVLSAAGKTQRYGFDSVNPLLSSPQQETNADWLWREMEDLKLAIASLQRLMRVTDPSAQAATLFRYFPTARERHTTIGSGEDRVFVRLLDAGLLRASYTAFLDERAVSYSLTAKGCEALGLLRHQAH